MHTAYLLVGSNIRPTEYIPKAIAQLASCGEIRAVSTTWETPPVGTDGPNFFNLAIQLETGLPAEALKEALRAIEQRLGRVRSADKYASRTMDLDILVYDGALMEPRMWAQPFAVIPLAELLPDYLDPEEKETLAERARQLLAAGGFTPRPEVSY